MFIKDLNSNHYQYENQFYNERKTIEKCESKQCDENVNNKNYMSSSVELGHIETETCSNEEGNLLIKNNKDKDKENFLSRTVTYLKKTFQLQTRHVKVVKEGDLCYGLAGPRLKFMRRNVKALGNTANHKVDGKVTGGKKRAVIVDTLNNQFLGTGYGGSKTSYEGAKEGEREDVANFRMFLEGHDKYNPNKCPRAADAWLRIGRACKGALEYTTKKSGGHIHFILDGMDFNRVISDLGKANEDRGITGKEIKWLYRHRDEKEVMEHVTFYVNGKPTEAPWVTNPVIWKTYDVYRQNKLSNSKKIFT